MYGVAAPHIRAYLDLLHDKMDNDNIHLRCFTNAKQASFLTAEILAEADQIFDRAENVVRDQADILQRVRFARMPVDLATVERTTREGVEPARIDHATFTVTPNDILRRHAERFLRTASAAGVKTMYIGVGDRNAPAPGGAGTLYVDDIRLIRSTP